MIEQSKEELQALRKKLNELQQVIDNIPCIVYWKDAEGKYLGRNRFAVEKMCELELENSADISNVVGKTDFDYFDRDTANIYRGYDDEVMNEGQTRLNEEVLTYDDGKSLYQLSQKSPLYDEKGHVVGVIGVTLSL